MRIATPHKPRRLRWTTSKRGSGFSSMSHAHSTWRRRRPRQETRAPRLRTVALPLRTPHRTPGRVVCAMLHARWRHRGRHETAARVRPATHDRNGRRCRHRGRARLRLANVRAPGLRDLQRDPARRARAPLASCQGRPSPHRMGAVARDPRGRGRGNVDPCPRDSGPRPSSRSVFWQPRRRHHGRRHCDEPHSGLLGGAIVSGLALRAFEFKLTPIAPPQGDMLPLVVLAVTNTLNGQPPYRMYTCPGTSRSRTCALLAGVRAAPPCRLRSALDEHAGRYSRARCDLLCGRRYDDKTLRNAAACLWPPGSSRIGS